MFILKKGDERTLGYYTATLIIIAAMIGTGIFTIPGYVAKNIPNPLLMVSAWIIVGVISLCGALCYAEISSVFNENGGEYLFLSKLIHPSVGFMSGWVSFIVGFSAPCAAAATAFGAYTSAITGLHATMQSALFVVLFFSVIHIIGVKTGGYLQNALTVLKILLVTVFIILGFSLIKSNNNMTLHFDYVYNNLINTNFWTSLLLISYAYAGWNTAVYISGEIKNPEKNIPLALISGTIIVLIIYVAINVIYTNALSLKEMNGILEIGYITMRKLYGESIGIYFSIGIAVALSSMISALIMAGSRLYMQIGKDINMLKSISKKSFNNTPIYAIILQCLITSLLIITMNYELLLYYIGFTLNIFSVITVASVFIIRNKKITTTFKVPLYPVPPILFIVFNLIILSQTIIQKPIESLIGFITIFFGYIIFIYSNKKQKKAASAIDTL